MTKSLHIDNKDINNCRKVTKNNRNNVFENKSIWVAWVL